MAKFDFIRLKTDFLPRCGPVQIALLLLSALSFIASFSAVVQWGFYHAELVVAGQWWRPFTAWFTQRDGLHWLINQWGVLVMLLLLPARLTRLQSLGFVVVWLYSSLCLLHSSYQAYVGLSGVLYGWLVLSAYYSPYYSRFVKAVFVAILLVKVLLENQFIFGLSWQSQTVTQLLQGPVAYRSHWWGISSGLAYLFLLALLHWFTGRSRRAPL